MDIHTTDETIMPDGRPFFAWKNELEILRNRERDTEKALKKMSIFKEICGLIYESWTEPQTLDWVFRMKAGEMVTAYSFQDALLNFLHIEKPTHTQEKV